MHLDTIEAQTASLQAVAGLGPRVRRSRWMRAGENIRSNLHLKKLLLVMKSAPEKLILKNLILGAHLMLWWRSAKWAAVFGCCPLSDLVSQPPLVLATTCPISKPPVDRQSAPQKRIILGLIPSHFLWPFLKQEKHWFCFKSFWTLLA